MTPPAGSQHLGAIIFKRAAGTNGGHFMTHHVKGAQPGERFAYRHLRHALLRGVQQEPADKSRPDTRHVISVEGHPGADENHAVSNDLACRPGNTRGPAEALCVTPYNGAKDPAPVEWKSRQEVENCQQAVRF